MLPKLEIVPYNQDMDKVKKTIASHGGKRAGAGRKPKQEASVRVSVPASTKELVVDFVKVLSDRKVSGECWPDSMTPIRLAENPSSFKVPFFGHAVRAGFPSPADDYVADTLDLNDHLMPRKEASYLIRAKGDSMVGAGIHDGDILIVDKSITAADGCVVIALLDGQFTVKTLEKKRGKIRLMPANPEFQPIDMKDEQELQIWGVVTNVIHSLKP